MLFAPGSVLKKIETLVLVFGMQVGASAPRMLKDHIYIFTTYGVPGFPMARSRVYKVLILVFCVLACLQRAPTKIIIRLVESEPRKFQQLDPQSIDPTI